MRPPRMVVIATHNRPVELRRCVEAIGPQADRIIIVDNASTPPVAYADFDGLPNGPDSIISDGEQPPNLSRLWNVGLTRAEMIMSHSGIDVYDVAVLNDDAVPPPGWFEAVSHGIRVLGADAASSDPFGHLPLGVYRQFGAEAPMAVTTRLAGWAMMLRGEWDGARFDERMRWWASDDDLSLRARQAGGLVHVGGFPVPNTGADTSTTGVLAEQAAKDMQTFVDIHGRRPW